MAETTTRAYTLKLKGDRLALWRNHVIFNRGVRAWGEWLLSLRGGLPAALADHKELLAVAKSDIAMAVKERVAAITPATIRQEAEFEVASDKNVRKEVATRRNKISEKAIAKELVAARRSQLRRILALSWLCPETPVRLVPHAAIVAVADDGDREQKVLDRFRKILKLKGVADPAAWLTDCDATLRAAIRSDAVWVDRVACFRSMPAAVRPSEQEAAMHLFRLFGSASDYFATDSSTSGPVEPKDFGPACRQWVCDFWGGGEKAKKSQIIESLSAIAQITPARVLGKSGPAALAVLAGVLKEPPSDDSVEALARAIGWKSGAHSSARMAINGISQARRITQKLWDQLAAACEKDCVRQKSASAFKGSASTIATALEPHMARLTGMPYSVSREKSGEYGTMLAFAMRRVSQIHTKAKQAEAERQSFAPEQARIALVPSAAIARLDSYVEERTVASGAIDGYQLRKRALGGWSEVVAAWDKCKTSEDRIDAVRELQADLEKPGDMQLFEALAADDAICVWRSEDGRGDPAFLTHYVAAAVAYEKSVHRKVPAYRHPDPLRSPSFIGFGNSQWSIAYSAQTEIRERKKHLERAEKSAKDAERARDVLANAPVLQQVSLDLWGLGEMRTEQYRWQSMRFQNDLALGSIQHLKGQTVSRATRLGTAGVSPGPFLMDGIAGDKKWSGRLQAPRRDLEDLARSLDARDLPYDDETKWPAKLQKRLRRLGWFLSHSARLSPSGPWLEYVAKGLPDGCMWSESKKLPYDWRLLYEANQGRKKRASVCLSRLPGLRVLSVDLGLRTSAAAAVWQVVSKRELTAAKEGADNVREGEIYCLVQRGPVERGGRAQVFRRIGPSAWARLERQFLIRLDGEQSAARPATNDEWAALQKLREWLGCAPDARPDRLPPVDTLQQQAVRLCRLGLRRLSDLARVAFFLSAKTRPIMGGRIKQLDEKGQIEAAQDALVIWHSLASSDEFQDSKVRQLWQTHIGDEPALADRLTKKQQERLRNALRPAAERLRGNVAVSGEFALLWQERIADWPKHLRWLRDWVIPRFNKRTHAERVRLARNVGGLSLDRIATIRGVYQIMRAYASRPEPTNLRAGVEKLEKAAAKKVRPEFGRRILAKMERLRENRVKQIASRIVEAALGVGSENRLHWDKGRKRPAAAIADPRFAACHAVVIENLENYRPDDKRTRRENRGLMNWSAHAIRKYLMEGCELHGLCLRQVSPAYTSRQDSRTGSPGLRCNDIPVKELTSPEGWIAKLIARAEEAVKDGNASPRQKLFVAVAEAARNGEIKWPTVRIIAPGGQLFVAANSSSPAACGIHADMNAAANIGLVALLDPDWSAAWWRLPCKTATGEVDESKVGGSAAVPVGKAILDPRAEAGKGYVNAWSDPQEKAVSRREWLDTKAYWLGIEERVVKILLAWNRSDGRDRRGELQL